MHRASVNGNGCGPVDTPWRARPRASRRSPPAATPRRAARAPTRVGDRGVAEHADDPPREERGPQQLPEERQQVRLARRVEPPEVPVRHLAAGDPGGGLEHQALVVRLDALENRDAGDQGGSGEEERGERAVSHRGGLFPDAGATRTASRSRSGAPRSISGRRSASRLRSLGRQSVNDEPRSGRAHEVACLRDRHAVLEQLLGQPHPEVPVRRPGQRPHVHLAAGLVGQHVPVVGGASTPPGRGSAASASIACCSPANTKYGSPAAWMLCPRRRSVGRARQDEDRHRGDHHPRARPRPHADDALDGEDRRAGSRGSGTSGTGTCRRREVDGQRGERPHPHRDLLPALAPRR